MSGRKLNVTELKLHQSALADPQKILTVRQAEVLVPDNAARMAAFNFLLGTGLLKAMRVGENITSYRAVTKQELEIKKDMSGEEGMVLSHIQASGNDGIWTKHLKAKTELHQTVIDRCLKSLMQKQLIKNVKSVKHHTRKIYMLFHLIPSPELTGGPWYTDNELDTDFIKSLSSACLRYIRDRTLPKHKKSLDPEEAHTQPLYPIGAAPSYPSAQQVQSFLTKSRLTETELTVEHVEMLLGVLVLDGVVEKVPSFGAAIWESESRNDRDNNMSGSEEPGSEDGQTGRKRKHKSKSKSSYKRRRTSRIDDESSGSGSDSESRKKISRSSSKSKGSSKSKNNRRHDDGSNTAESDVDISESEKKRKKKRRLLDGAAASETESDGSDSHKRKHSRSHSRNSKRSPSPPNLSIADYLDDSLASSFVYRAIRQERVALGWSQAPCGGCPVFDFCKAKGPVNPWECVYYEDWLASGAAGRENGVAKVEI